ncbi:hypothetical protein T440DRAFT_72493 [Plenodomus tracheiphilus IPT5]|uniref:Uncharacterized protein n=1 Tax=Plenodomus tracheiphilus IPT5 TaxID=1408161 RepID=A0A6A7B724_9PLEO|nr:hypothetical protein T440DRAFT_72493 [Plenodomus tracheiphilus IPT5]
MAYSAFLDTLLMHWSDWMIHDFDREGGLVRCDGTGKERTAWERRYGVEENAAKDCIYVANERMKNGRVNKMDLNSILRETDEAGPMERRHGESGFTLCRYSSNSPRTDTLDDCNVPVRDILALQRGTTRGRRCQKRSRQPTATQHPKQSSSPAWVCLARCQDTTNEGFSDVFALTWRRSQVLSNRSPMTGGSAKIGVLPYLFGR